MGLHLCASAISGGHCHRTFLFVKAGLGQHGPLEHCGAGRRLALQADLLLRQSWEGTLARPSLWTAEDQPVPSGSPGCHLAFLKILTG